MTTPGRDDPERDAWLRAALAHAPDADIAAPPALSAAILRGAAHPPRAAAPALGQRLLDAWSWLARPPVAAAFASVMLATVVGVMWWGRPIDEAMPRPPAALRSEAPAAAAVAAPAAEHPLTATTEEAGRAKLALNAPPAQPPAAAADAEAKAGSGRAAAPSMALRKTTPTSSAEVEADLSIKPPVLAARTLLPAPTPAPAAIAAETSPAHAPAPWPGPRTSSATATESAKADENTIRRAADEAAALRERRSEPHLLADAATPPAGRALAAAPAAPAAVAVAPEAPSESMAPAISGSAAPLTAQAAALGRAESTARAAMSPLARLLSRWSPEAVDWRWQAPDAIAPHPAGADAWAWLSRLEHATRGRWAAAPAPSSNGTLAQWWQGDVAMGSVQFEAAGLRWLGPDGRAQFAPLDAVTLAALRSF